LRNPGKLIKLIKALDLALDLGQVVLTRKFRIAQSVQREQLLWLLQAKLAALVTFVKKVTALFVLQSPLIVSIKNLMDAATLATRFVPAAPADPMVLLDQEVLLAYPERRAQEE
jgi:hypothetical protein